MTDDGRRPRSEAAAKGAAPEPEPEPEPESMVYEVFARKSRGEALRHIGNLNASNDELARVYAFQTYDEERWFDMWIVPRGALVEVFSLSESGTAAGWWSSEASTAGGSP